MIHRKPANMAPIVIHISYPQNNTQIPVNQNAIDYHTVADPDISLTALWDCFYKYKIDRVKASTLEAYYFSFEQFKKDNSHIKSVNQVTDELVEQFMNKRSKEVSPATVNKDRRHLRCIWNVAIRKGLIDDNNAIANVQSLKEPLVNVTVLDRDDIAKLVKAIDSGRYKSVGDQLRIKAAILIAVEAGLRSNEIRHLRWADIDLETSRVDVRCRETWSTKNGKDRISYVLEDTLVVLKELKALRVWSEDDMPLTFANHRFSIGRKFKKVAAQAGVNGTLHDLRRTCATWMAEAGESTFVITAVLGHSSPLTTQKYYTNVSAYALQQAVTRAQRGGFDKYVDPVYHNPAKSYNTFKQ